MYYHKITSDIDKYVTNSNKITERIFRIFIHIIYLTKNDPT